MTTPQDFAARMQMTPARAAEFAADIARRMGMDAARAAEFAADIARLAEQVAPLVYAKLKEPKE